MKDAHPYELKNFSNIQNSAIQNWIQKEPVSILREPLKQEISIVIIW